MIYEALKMKGVVMPAPEAIHISPEVLPDNIAPGAVLHPGCRIEGAATVIGAGAAIGVEGPAVVRDCQLAANVTLGSGFFDGSVFLEGASMGGGAHIRPGCLLEEQASGAHSVGLKQTVLFPFVTLGSLVNFCDCLMAGGTSRKNHSEVGSSYIHFNFTPHQDKATASLVGDVVQGVWLDQPPIFLGGQGGLVGPARIAYGSVVPAGQILRQDIVEPGRLVVQPSPHATTKSYHPETFGAMDRLVSNNLLYIGHIKALIAWYRHVRAPLMRGNPWNEACHAGALRVLGLILKERIKRLEEVVDKLPGSLAVLSSRQDDRGREHARQQEKLIRQWPIIKATLEKDIDAAEHVGCQQLLTAIKEGANQLSYMKWIHLVNQRTRTDAIAWLDTIAGSAAHLWKISE